MCVSVVSGGGGSATVAVCKSSVLVGLGEAAEGPSVARVVPTVSLVVPSVTLSR